MSAQPSLFDQPINYRGKPRYTRARTSHPETSHAAAPTERDVLAAATRRNIHELLKAFDLTDEQIADIAQAEGWYTSPSGMRTRRAELVEARLVFDTGKRKTTKTNRKTIVWRASNAQPRTNTISVAGGVL